MDKLKEQIQTLAKILKGHNEAMTEMVNLLDDCRKRLEVLENERK